MSEKPKRDLYQMITPTGGEYWLPLYDASVEYAGEDGTTRIGGLILDSLGIKRRTTPEEKFELYTEAEKYRTGDSLSDELV